MKHKMLAVIVALTVTSWAQTATQSPPDSKPGTASTEKAKCGCCEKMASSKDGKMSCMRHAAKDGKETASCCGGKDCCAGKDAKSCMKDAKDMGSCCKDCGKDKMAAACCGKDCKECSCSGKKEKTASNCCEHAIGG